MKVSNKSMRTMQEAQANTQTKSLKKGNAKNKLSSLASPVSSSKVNLSTQAQQIKKATEIAKKDTVNEKKVAHLQSLIDSGKYKVDAAKIADKLVDEHMKMPT